MSYMMAMFCIASLVLGQQPTGGAVTASDLSDSVKPSSGENNQSRTSPEPEPNPSSPSTTTTQGAAPSAGDAKEKAVSPPPPKTSDDRKSTAPTSSGKRVPAFWIILPEN